MSNNVERSAQSEAQNTSPEPELGSSDRDEPEFESFSDDGRTSGREVRNGEMGSENAESAEDSQESLDGERQDIENIEEGEDSENAEMLDFDHTRKDENELELEKLVFGDSAGFRSALQDFEDSNRASKEPDTRRTDDETLRAILGDGFAIDTGGSEALKPGSPEPSRADEDGEEKRVLPAWEDSDDERMQISLMSVPRLRKLRHFEGEDVISGREYQRRLRQQYRALHPTPEWASWHSPEVSQTRPRKRRKVTMTDANGNADSSESDSDISTADAETAPAPTLSSLLRTSRSFTRSHVSKVNGSSSIPRLNPSTLDIDRLPDIVSSSSPQPHSITSLSLHSSLPLVITAGLSGMLYMHHIRPFPTPPDPSNPQVTSLHMKNTPLSTATFSPLTGTRNEPKIYMAAGRRSFHTWTLPTGNIAKTTRIGGEQLGERQQRVRVIKASPCGRYIAIQGSSKKGGGFVNVLSASTLQWVAQARGEGRGGLADFCWWSDGEGLSLVGKLGEVAEWSVEERRIVLRWQDQGGVGITVMALGGGMEGSKKRTKDQDRTSPDRWAVLGTNSGFVTIYDRSKLASKFAEQSAVKKRVMEEDEEDERPFVVAPTPHATLDHLTTPISHLSISSCGQILAMASKWKRNALRLVHMSSGTVYQNWPTVRTPLGRISSMTLGESEGIVQGSQDDEGRGIILIVGNEQGTVKNWVVKG